MRITMLLTMLAVSLLLAGCPKSDAVKEPPATSGEPGTSEGLLPGEAQPGESMEDAAQRALLQQRVIYFDFDSYEIPAQYRDIVAAHARHLSTTGSTRARLEGHTDERGSREYNIGLGERRAQAVRRALMLQGTSDSQLVTVSYGEERPAVAGSEETAWAKNRRVEIIYGGN